MAKLLSASDYAAFEKQRRQEVRRRESLVMHERLMDMVREMAGRLRQSAPGITKELLSQQLRASIPGAVYRCRLNSRPRAASVTALAC